MRLKDCPGCDFRPGVAARVCPGCGHLFPDSPPDHVRRWVLETAQKVRAQHPEMTLEELGDYLQEHLLADPGLLRAMDERPDPMRWAVRDQGLMDRVERLLLKLWTMVTGSDPIKQAGVHNAVLDALDVLEGRERQRPRAT